MNENLPLLVTFICGGMLGSCLGFLAAGITAANKERRAAKRAWNQARIFYTHAARGDD